MNDQSHPWRESVSASLLERVDQICDQFEDAWLKAGSGGPRPHIEVFLPNASEPEHMPLVCELILLDANYRRWQGENPQAGEYQARFSSLDLASLAEVLAAHGRVEPQTGPARSGVETTGGAPVDVPPQTKTTRIEVSHTKESVMR